MTRARRAFFLAFVLGLIATTVAMFWTAYSLKIADASSNATAELLGLTFFRATRTVGEAQTTVTLRPAVGVVVLLVVLPAAAALLAHLTRQGRTPREG